MFLLKLGCLLGALRTAWGTAAQKLWMGSTGQPYVHVFLQAAPWWPPSPFFVIYGSVLFPTTSLLSGGDINKRNQLWTDTGITLTDTKNISKPFSITSFLCGFTSSGPSWSPWPCHVSVNGSHFSRELWQKLWICAVLFYDDDLLFVLQSCLEASSKIRASSC